MAVPEFPPATHYWCETPLLPAVRALLPDGWRCLEAVPPPAAPWSNAGAVLVIFASSLVHYTGAVMDECANLRVIARVGIGVDNVDLDAATARGILVCNTPDGPTESTAEHTVAMLLALAKRLPQGAANLASGKWGPRMGLLLGNEVRGKTLGLVGLGRIGRRVAEICRLAFSMRVLAVDPILTAAQAAALGVELTTLEVLLAEADFVSLHAPALPETWRLMNAERFALMKPGAILLNMARGALVDEAALLAALESGRLAAAGLDVFDPEPPALGSSLRTHPRVLATPHMAALTVEGFDRMQRMAAENVLAIARGEGTPNVVNPEVLGQPGASRTTAP